MLRRAVLLAVSKPRGTPVAAQDQPWTDGARFQRLLFSATDGLLHMHSVTPAGPRARHPRACSA